VAEIGEAGPGNEADIAGADHGNAHQNYSPVLMRFHHITCINNF
jgi:hypothetical protein